MKCLSIDRSLRSASSRRGAFMVVVLVCLLVAGMLMASLLKVALLQDRQVGYEQARLQAAWLADSGIARATGRLVVEPAYVGETWNIEPADLGGQQAAVVVITVQKDDGNPELQTIVVEAVYPSNELHHARLTRHKTIGVP